MATRFGQSPFVGRQRELSGLRARLQAAAQGESGAVLVGGEPGVGKSRILRELAGSATASGLRVLSGHSADAEGMPPYLPFVEALAAHVRACPLPELQEQLGAGAPEVALLVPELRRRLPAASADAGFRSASGSELSWERYRLFESVCDFLFAVAGSKFPDPGSEGAALRARNSELDTGMLLILEDLHWCDAAGLLLLQHLTRRLAGASVPLLVAGSYRTTGLTPDHPLSSVLATLLREHTGELLALQPLPPEDSGALVRQLSAAPVAGEVATAIHTETAGSPFFVEELVHHLQAEGYDLANQATASTSWGVPEGVQQVIGAGLARLSAEANQLLQAGAVLGDGFAFDTLALTCPLPGDALLLALDEVLAAGMLHEGHDTYHFRHALVREAVYEGLSLPRRQRRHLQAAEAIEQGDRHDQAAHLAALAMHYRLAGPSGREKALKYCLQAAEAAEAACAWEQAVQQRQEALRLIDENDSARRCELLLSLAEAQAATSDPESAKDSYTQAAALARASGDRQSLVAAAIGMSRRPFIRLSRLPEHAALLEEAISAVGEDEPVLRARALSALVGDPLQQGADPRWESLAEEALTLARRHGDAALLAEALAARHNLLWAPDHASERAELAAEMIELALESGQDGRELSGRALRIRDLIESGDFAAARAETHGLQSRAAALRRHYYIWGADFLQAGFALAAGDLVAAARLSQEAWGAAARGRDPSLQYFFAIQMAQILEEQGALTDELLPGWVALLEPIPDLHVGYAALAWIYCELGLLDNARRILDRLSVDAFARIKQPMLNWLACACSLARTCSTLGDKVCAAELYEQLLPYGALIAVVSNTVLIYGSVHRYLGLLAGALERWNDATSHFEAALVLDARTGSRAWFAHTQLDLATALARIEGSGPTTQGERRERALDLLDAALSAANELGLARLAAQAEALREKIHVGMRPSPSQGSQSSTLPDGLTRREAEVLGLVASGLTNNEIADTLVLSIATVQRHTVNLYRKIGARGRAEATAYAFRHGLVPQR